MLQIVIVAQVYLFTLVKIEKEGQIQKKKKLVLLVRFFHQPFF